jgi:hypothetical protein
MSVVRRRGFLLFYIRLDVSALISSPLFLWTFLYSDPQVQHRPQRPMVGSIRGNLPSHLPYREDPRAPRARHGRWHKVGELRTFQRDSPKPMSCADGTTGTTSDVICEYQGRLKPFL